MPRVTFRGDNNLLGITSPFAAFSYQAALSDVERSFDGGIFTIVAKDVSMIDVATVVSFVGLGGSVQGFPVFIKIASANYEDNALSSLPNATYVNEADETVNRKWSEWHDSTHVHTDASDGAKLIAGNSWGEELTGVEIKALVDGGYNVLTASQYLAELPTPE